MKSRRKARFGVSKVKNDLVCNCFNCGWAGSFVTYLKYQHPDLARKVQRESFVTSNVEANYNDLLVSLADSEILREIYYINTNVDNKLWLADLQKRKIRFEKKDSVRKLLKLFAEKER